MILFPAIDILEGRAVRLFKGDKNAVTDYGDPLAFAEKWVEAGAEWLHIVDLSGAFSGSSGIDPVITAVKRHFPVRIQSGGGLRTADDFRRRLDAGADRAVLGTMAAEDPALFERLAIRYPEYVVAGIDAKDGFLCVRGWTQKTDVSAADFGRRCHEMGIRHALFTDISRDGALQGPNVAATSRLQRETGLSVIASGGVSSEADLAALQGAGVYGAVLGKALYEGRLDLKAALALCR